MLILLISFYFYIYYYCIKFTFITDYILHFEYYSCHCERFIKKAPVFL